MKGFDIINKVLKFKYDFSPILYNRFILYFICFLAGINVIYFTNTNDIQSLVVFVLIGILTSFFSKNMIVILVISMCFSHVLKYGTGNRYEGFDNKDDATINDQDNKDEEDEYEDDENNMPNVNSKKQKTSTESMKDKLEPASVNQKDKVSKKEIMEAYDDYQGVQEEIINGIKRIQPLLDKAKHFVNKYESYTGMSAEEIKQKYKYNNLANIASGK